jgi:gliding motility-associated-like protein
VGADARLRLQLPIGSTFDVQISKNNTTILPMLGVTNGYEFTENIKENTDFSITKITSNATYCAATQKTHRINVQTIQTTITASDFHGFGISCNGKNDGTAKIEAKNGIPPYEFTWSSGSKNALNTQLKADKYTVTVTDTRKCTQIDSLTLTEPQPISFVLQGISPDCFGDTNGKILIDSLRGGSTAYTYALGNHGFVNIENFNTTITNVVAGAAYPLTIKDNNGCLLQKSIFVPHAPKTNLSLGTSKTIRLGETIVIAPSADFKIDKYVWKSTDSLSCLNCAMPSISPKNMSTVQLTAFDEKGCSVKDILTILVDKTRNIYIPTAFTPDEDGNNDVFLIHGGKDVKQVVSLKIYSRWGDFLYEKANFPINTESHGWNGVYRGKVLPTDMYIYVAEIEFIDGFKQIFKGQVQLIR